MKSNFKWLLLMLATIFLMLLTHVKGQEETSLSSLQQLGTEEMNETLATNDVPKLDSEQGIEFVNNIAEVPISDNRNLHLHNGTLQDDDGDAVCLDDPMSTVVNTTISSYSGVWLNEEESPVNRIETSETASNDSTKDSQVLNMESLRVPSASGTEAQGLNQSDSVLESFPVIESNKSSKIDPDRLNSIVIDETSQQYEIEAEIAPKSEEYSFSNNQTNLPASLDLDAVLQIVNMSNTTNSNESNQTKTLGDIDSDDVARQIKFTCDFLDYHISNEDHIKLMCETVLETRSYQTNYSTHHLVKECVHLIKEAHRRGVIRQICDLLREHSRFIGELNWFGADELVNLKTTSLVNETSNVDPISVLKTSSKSQTTPKSTGPRYPKAPYASFFAT